ncbi:hypothetical protein Barb4_04490 [Bacteroidales bacterium Barb4]|nr:hypothetical protein Barb4_04490 [Bacteroidales bacterium Barb4]
MNLAAFQNGCLINHQPYPLAFQQGDDFLLKGSRAAPRDFLRTNPLYAV